MEFKPKLCGARAEPGSFAALARLGKLALFAPSRVEFFVKFNIKFPLKFFVEFSQGSVLEAFTEFKALFSAQLGISADFKFSARAAEFKADFLSIFLTRGTEYSAAGSREARLRTAKPTKAG